MSKILRFPEHKKILEEAGDWLIRIDRGPLSENESRSLSAWINKSPHHKNTIIELCTLWDDMEILSVLSEFCPLATTEKMPRYSKLRAFFHRPVYSHVLLAVCLILLLGILSYQWGLTSKIQEISGPEEVLYQTSLGEQQEIMLADDSVVILNTNSLIRVQFNQERRYIRLVRGEVYFEVTHDPARPFIVNVAGSLVRAVGTAFSIRIKDQSMEVTVSDGKVEVASMINHNLDVVKDINEAVSNNYLTTLNVGQMAEFTENSINFIKKIEPEDVSRKFLWQHGMLEFKGESLAEVVSEIGRYTEKKIIISDRSIRDIRIGGYFKIGEIDSLLSILNDGFSIKANRIDENLIYLSKATNPSTP